jgi:hypothetical protein
MDLTNICIVLNKKIFKKKKKKKDSSSPVEPELGTAQPQLV